MSTDNGVYGCLRLGYVWCKTRFSEPQKQRLPRGVLSRLERRPGTTERRRVAVRTALNSCILAHRSRRAVPKKPKRSRRAASLESGQLLGPSLVAAPPCAASRAVLESRQPPCVETADNKTRAAAAPVRKQTGLLPVLRPGGARRDQGFSETTNRPVRS